MTTDELTQLKELLERERSALLADLEHNGIKNPLIKDDYQTRIEPSDPSDTADEKANNISDFEVNMAVNHDLEARLHEITATLEKINAGVYGNCANCGSPIHVKRLEAVPTAVHCLDCATKAQLL